VAELERDGLVWVVPGKARIVCAPGEPPELSSLPLYQQVAAELRAQIERGEYAQCRRLPSEPELVRRHRVSRETVRRAFTELQVAGLVCVVHGKGRFVREDAMAPCETS
jgi:DNA-binding GntR family transcriptional regulator